MRTLTDSDISNEFPISDLFWTCRRWSRDSNVVDLVTSVQDGVDHVTGLAWLNIWWDYIYLFLYLFCINGLILRSKKDFKSLYELFSPSLQ